MSPIVNLPTILQSNCIHCTKANLSSAKVTIHYSGGSLRFFFGLSNDPLISPATWEEVTTIVNGTIQTYTFTGTGTALYYRIIKDFTTTIQTPTDNYGTWTAPAISISSITTA